MTTINIATFGLLIAIIALGAFFAWLFRHDPRTVLNIALLTLGLALLTYGHLQWAGRHESPEVLQAMFIRHVIAGWAMAATGFLGLQSGRSPDQERRLSPSTTPHQAPGR